MKPSLSGTMPITGIIPAQLQSLADDLAAARKRVRELEAENAELRAKLEMDENIAWERSELD